MEKFVDIFLFVSYILVIIAVLVAILMPLINSFGNPRSLLKSGAGVLGLLLLFFIAYAVSGNEVTVLYSKFDVGPELSKLVGGSLIMAYILSVISLVSIVFTEISKLLK